jgi:hypothetical protein
MLTLLATLATAALGATPLDVKLTAAEQAQLEAGQIVVRAPTDTGLIVGAVDIPATRKQILSAVMDFDARVQSVGAITAIDTYAPATDPAGLGARFTLSVLGVEVVYHIRYDVTDEGCTFALDEARENGIVATEGGYWTYPTSDDDIRLVYWSTTDTGRSVPGFIRNSLSVRSFRNQLQAMREQAPAK